MRLNLREKPRSKQLQQNERNVVDNQPPTNCSTVSDDFLGLSPRQISISDYHLSGLCACVICLTKGIPKLFVLCSDLRI